MYYLISLNDDLYDIVDNTELDKMTHSAISFDGFLGFTIVNRGSKEQLLQTVEQNKYKLIDKEESYP